MDICFNLEHTICIPSGWVEIAKLVASLIALIIAGLGLKTWIRQLKGTNTFEIQKHLISTVSYIDYLIKTSDEILFKFIVDANSYNEFHAIYITDKNIDLILSGLLPKIDEFEKLIIEKKPWIITHFNSLQFLNENLNYFCIFLDSFYSNKFPKGITDKEIVKLILTKNTYIKNIIATIETINTDFSK